MQSAHFFLSNILISPTAKDKWSKYDPQFLEEFNLSTKQSKVETEFLCENEDAVDKLDCHSVLALVF